VPFAATLAALHSISEIPFLIFAFLIRDVLDSWLPISLLLRRWVLGVERGVSSRRSGGTFRVFYSPEMCERLV